MTSDRSDDRAVTRFLLVALILPTVFVAVGVVVQLLALPHVPATIAIHWDAAGVPNGYGPAWLQPIMTLALGLGLPALMAATSLPGLRRGDRGASYRFMGAMALALSVLVTVLLTVTLVLQRAPEGAAVELSPWPTILIALGLAVASGFGAWFVQPAGPWRTPAPPSAAPLSLAPGERAVWLGTASIGRAGVLGIVGLTLLVCVGALVLWMTGAPGPAAAIVTGVAALLVVLAATTVSFHVRIDETGIRVDSVAGLPRFRVPLAEVASAAAVDVVPMGEFGGWGIRWAPGRRFGVVLRTGEAIEVTRTDGRRFVVTVDDAATGAALLEALTERAAQTAP